MLSIQSRVFDTICEEDQITIMSDPIAYDAFVEGNEESILAAFYWLYCQTEIVARNEFLTTPAFLLELDNKIGKEWDAMNRGSIWQFAGVQRHTEINGTIRPVVEVNLSDLRKIIKGN